MKVIYRFFSVQNLLIFGSIFFLSQNVMAGFAFGSINLGSSKYIERGFIETDKDSVWIIVYNGTLSKIKNITVTVDDSNTIAECVNGKSVTNGQKVKYLDLAKWFLNPNCKYTISATSTKGNKKSFPTSRPFFPEKACGVGFGRNSPWGKLLTSTSCPKD